MPKIGIIYNDIKPIACKTAHQIQDQLLSLGWQVFMADRQRWSVGHSKPSRPVCFTPYPIS
jgi:NAD+ kinase